MKQTWCGLCAAYVDHDTNHHGSGGGPTVGDLVTLDEVPPEWIHLKGRRGRVESTQPGGLLQIGVPTSGGTMTVQVKPEDVTRL